LAMMVSAVAASMGSAAAVSSLHLLARIAIRALARLGFQGQERLGFQGEERHAPCTLESLNEDPYNLRAEQLALEECAAGAEVRRTWSEREMVRVWDGGIVPGTPDGMFETWDGALTCVQVVRVPLVPESDIDSMQETLVQTLLKKVVKSQQWLCASQVVPHDFILFCWLPFPVPETVSEHGHSLIQRVRVLDPRFSLRLHVPPDARDLFPPLFARFLKEKRSLSESDVSSYTGPTVDAEEEDMAIDWDFTWDGDQDWASAPEDLQELGEGEETEIDDEAMFAWDITWEWESDWAVASAEMEGTSDEDAMRGWVIVWDDGG